MPRYFFNVYDGIDVLDEEGVVLEGVREVRVYMLATAKAWIEQVDHQHSHWFLEARDDDGNVVGSMRFGVKPENGAA